MRRRQHADDRPNFRDRLHAPADRFNFAPFNYMQIPLERYGAVRQPQI